jgi:hypothetical protein
LCNAYANSAGTRLALTKEPWNGGQPAPVQPVKIIELLGRGRLCLTMPKGIPVQTTRGRRIGHSSATEYESTGCGGAYPLAVTRDSMWAGIKPDRYGPTFTPRIIPPMRLRATSDARILMSRREPSVACVAAMAAHATRVAAINIGFMEALRERSSSRD